MKRFTCSVLDTREGSQQTITKNGVINGVAIQCHMHMQQVLHCKMSQSISWKHCRFYSEYMSQLAAKASMKQHTPLLPSMYTVSC